MNNDARGRLTFVYDSNWREARGSYPISLSMLLAAEEHGPAAVQAFLWGLLPDNERVLDRWAKKFQVSARNVFALISHVGEDCAGAVQFIITPHGGCRETRDNSASPASNRRQPFFGKRIGGDSPPAAAPQRTF